MSMDTNDLPRAVQRAVIEYDEVVGMPTFLRLEAAGRLAAVGPVWRAGEWAAVIELLAVAQGFLTASMRAEEEKRAA